MNKPKTLFSLIFAVFCLFTPACGGDDSGPSPDAGSGAADDSQIVATADQDPNPNNCLGVMFSAHTADYAVHKGAPVTAHVKAGAYRLRLSSTIFASFSYSGQSFSSEKKTLDYLPAGQVDGFLEVVVDTPFAHIPKAEVLITVSGPDCQMTKRIVAVWQLNM